MRNEEIYLGVGRRCINPSMPVGLAGYFNVRMAESVLEDIEVRVMLFKSGGIFSAIIQYDLIAVSEELWTALLGVLKKAGIEELGVENIIATATHTHTAPEVRSSRGGYACEYVAFAAEKTLEALRDAMADLAVCSVEHGMTAEMRFMFNRRYWMKNGEVLTNPGKGNPEIIRPEGEIDPEIPLLAFRSRGRIKALIANIVNHSDTVGGNSVSGDWPGFFIRNLQRELQHGAMVIPLIGASGNINHFDVASTMGQSSYHEAERIGKGYADRVGVAIEFLRPAVISGISVFSKLIKMHARELSEKEIEDAQAIIDRYPEIDVDIVGGAALTAEELARKTPYALKFFAVSLLKAAKEKKDKSFIIVRLDIGASVILAMPCEPFVEIGLTVRKSFFRNKTVLLASLANGSGTGYIPNIWNYGRGGYETTPRSNPYSTDTSELLFGACRELANIERT